MAQLWYNGDLRFWNGKSMPRVFFFILAASLPYLMADPAATDPLPFDLLQLPQLQPVLHIESDYELTKTLVEQTQAQLEDFECLAEEYERFRKLEEQFSLQQDSRELASHLIECAVRIQEIFERRHLKEFFSPAFIEKVQVFARLKRTPSEG